LRSELDVPVIVNGETDAVINLSKKLNACDEVDRELMETALYVASALQRSLLTLSS
jgi:putative methionine-R-sulfoxide reductase with GAF domain